MEMMDEVLRKISAEANEDEEIGPQPPRASDATSSRNIELASGVLPAAEEALHGRVRV